MRPGFVGHAYVHAQGLAILGERGLKPHLFVFLCGPAVRFLDIRHAFALEVVHALREMVHRWQVRERRVRVAVRRRRPTICSACVHCECM